MSITLCLMGISLSRPGRRKVPHSTLNHKNPELKPHKTPKLKPHKPPKLKPYKSTKLIPHKTPTIKSQRSNPRYPTFAWVGFSF
jgi:hypothetical protein